MESRNTHVNFNRKRVLGAIFLTLFSLAFIFSCMHKILPVGRAIVGTFGVMTFPMLLFLMLISLAAFLGFSYTRNMKSTTYFCLTILCVFLCIQSISTFKSLDAVVGWKTFGSYLAISYKTKITFLGSFGSLACGFISMMLGAMGAIVVFVIFGTLFAGLFIDYQFYGKYEEQPHIKKLKTRAMREKVFKSDKKKTETNFPTYSFKEDSSDVVGEITINENEINTNTSIYETNYTNNDIIGEISNDEISDDTAYYGVEEQEQNSSQTPNTFSQEFYQEPTYPSVFTDGKDEERRAFMTNTFGNTYSSSSVQETPAYDSTISEGLTFEEPEEEQSQFGGLSNEIFGGYSDNNLNNEISELEKILKTSDDDIVNDVKQDVFEEQITPSSGFDYGVNNNPVSQPSFEPKPVNPYGFGGFSEPEPTRFEPVKIQPTQYRPEPTYVEPPRIPEPPAPIQRPVIPEPIIVPPKKPVQQPKVSGNNIQNSMIGVRYNPPPLSLLSTPKPDNGDYSAEQSRKAGQLERVLAAFNINAKVENIVRGPKITRFELSVPLGTTVKKIPQYENDILAALAAKTVTIRAPIPGSTLVGIETENDTFTTVYQREIFECDAFQNFKDPLPIAIGKDISGEIIVKSLADLTHLLIAGSTNSGKSVFIHNIILSLIYKHSPEELKLIMIDPKRVEFPRYNGLPHLVTPEVIQGAEKAIGALRWCVKEMDRRYDLMSKAGYNNIKPYNKSDLVKAGQFERFPYVVIIVDELAEIMQANKKEAEPLIQRITQLARAAGMHLVVATQRPSVDIITGVIKNNIPSRVAFSLQSGVDSKTIIGTVGAEKLLGRGDMLFSPTGTSAMPRLQASYASDDEIARVVDYIKKNNQANYDEEVERAMENSQNESVEDAGGSSSGGFVDAPPPKEVDQYFKTAVKLVMANGGASVSYLQRRLQIGYSRAARIIDQMEAKGFIANSTGAKLRKVLITPEQFLEEFGEEYNSID